MSRSIDFPMYSDNLINRTLVSSSVRGLIGSSVGVLQKLKSGFLVVAAVPFVIEGQTSKEG